MYRDTADELAFATAGTNAITIDANQNVALATGGGATTAAGNLAPAGDGSDQVSAPC